MDSLRFDHLGCYGYKRPTTPNIDRFAKEGILFTNAIAQASWTLPSNASLFTGQYPPSHGALGGNSILSPEAITLAEVLQTYGYQTVAFTGGFHISSIYGVGQGFETYFDKIEHGTLEKIQPLALEWLKTVYPVRDSPAPYGAGHLPYSSNSAKTPIEKYVSSLSDDKSIISNGAGKDKKPFFMFLQAYDCHSPHNMPPEYEHLYDPDYKGSIDNFSADHSLGDKIEGLTLTTDKDEEIQLTQDDINHIIAHYDGAITYADKQLGALFEFLKKSGITDNTIIIFLGDHGEAHMDHGYIIRRKHGGIYEEGIHVPLIIKFPSDVYKQAFKINNRSIDISVQMIDVMPTILDMLGVPVPALCQGRSLVKLLEGKASPDFNEFVFSTGSTNIAAPLKRIIYRPQKGLPYYRQLEWQVCIRSKEWKLLKFNNGARYELYNLKNDPHEKNDLLDKEPELVSKLKERIELWEKEISSVKLETKVDNRLYKEMRERMEKYGYWWLADPEDIRDKDHQDKPELPPAQKENK
jgi:arylsulfatase A-like enzyme